MGDCGDFVGCVGWEVEFVVEKGWRRGPLGLQAEETGI